MKLKNIAEECQSALVSRQSEYDSEKEKQDEIQSIRNQIVSDVEITNEAFGFTDDEINIIQSFYKHTDYKNDNFYVSQYATPEEEVDEQYRLFLDAKDALYAKSHPQYIYTDSIDNLYALPEFQVFQKQLNIFDFIHVETSLGYQEKLRVISISYNPCMLEDDLEIEFTSMVQYNAKINDYAQLLNAQNNDAKNKILGTTGSKNDLEYNIDSSVIKMILQSMSFGTAVKNEVQSSYNSSIFAFNNILNENLTTDNIIKILNNNELLLSGLLSKYINSDTVITNILNASEGNIQELTSKLITTDEIISKLAKDEDIWFHTRLCAGSHVLHEFNGI